LTIFSEKRRNSIGSSVSPPIRKKSKKAPKSDSKFSHRLPNSTHQSYIELETLSLKHEDRHHSEDDTKVMHAESGTARKAKSEESKVEVSVKSGPGNMNKFFNEDPLSNSIGLRLGQDKQQI
jgi:hypothetical protein